MIPWVSSSGSIRRYGGRQRDTEPDSRSRTYQIGSNIVSVEELVARLRTTSETLRRRNETIEASFKLSEESLVNTRDQLDKVEGAYQGQEKIVVELEKAYEKSTKANELLQDEILQLKQTISANSKLDNCMTDGDIQSKWSDLFHYVQGWAVKVIRKTKPSEHLMLQLLEY